MEASIGKRFEGEYSQNNDTGKWQENRANDTGVCGVGLGINYIIFMDMTNCTFKNKKNPLKGTAKRRGRNDKSVHGGMTEEVKQFS